MYVHGTADRQSLHGHWHSDVRLETLSATASTTPETSSPTRLTRSRRDRGRRIPRPRSTGSCQPECACQFERRGGDLVRPQRRVHPRQRAAAGGSPGRLFPYRRVERPRLGRRVSGIEGTRAVGRREHQVHGPCWPAFDSRDFERSLDWRPLTGIRRHHRPQPLRRRGQRKKENPDGSSDPITDRMPGH